MIAVIPKASICKISLYVNTGRKTMAAIQQETGCTYILNGGLYDMAKFQAINHLTVDGKVLSANGNPYGYGIKGPTMIFSYGNNVKADNFLGAYPVLVRDGKATGAAAPVGLEGYRPRSAVGVTADGDIVLLCEQAARSLDGIAQELVEMGCETAINLDGGGSSQCIFDGEALNSARIVHNYLLIWTGEQEDKPNDNEEKEEPAMLNVLLIAGHGAGDPGAVANGIQEADETRAVVSNLDTQLQGICNVDIYPTDRNAYADLKAGKLAVRWSDYDYVLEVHFNAFDGAPSDGKTKGVECYVTTSEGGISVEEAICKNIASLGLTNRGVKRKNWDVIQAARSAGVSSALLEVCFLDDPDDMRVYNANKTAVATAIAAGIVSGFGIQPQPPAPEPTQPWYQEAMDWAKEYGLMDGTRPLANVTRAELATALWRMYKLLGGA